MRTILFIILTLAGSSSFSQTGNPPAGKIWYKFVELNHGLSAAKETMPASNKDSSAWSHTSTQQFKIIKTTDSVPLRLNTVFGVEFQVNGKQTSDLHYTQEWVYPTPMKEEDGRKYRSTKTNAAMASNTPNNFYYTFDQPYELLKGNWKLNVYIENELVYSHTFIAY